LVSLIRDLPPCLLTSPSTFLFVCRFCPSVAATTALLDPTQRIRLSHRGIDHPVLRPYLRDRHFTTKPEKGESSNT
jgi:hypothetical protein